MEKDVKSVLKENGFGFKKKFGQNFITDKNLLASIVSLAGVEEDDTVIEIGCGAGTLTRALAERAKRVVGFEVDESLKPVLSQTLEGIKNTEIIFKDFLKVNISAFEQKLGSGYKVVANLPYYITTPLIMQFIEYSKNCKSLSVMVQEEVAFRLCAQAGTSEYGAITAAVALRADAKIIKKVPRTLFYPVPNVDSAVVHLTLRDGRICVKDKELYKKVVRAAFSSRRKTLENNLVNNFKISRENAQAILSACGIDLKARGETLTPEQFATLSDGLKNYID